TSILNIAEVFHISSDFSHVRKDMEIRAILENQKPNGIFVSGDSTAMLVWNVIRSMKLSIQEDIKLIVYDVTSFIENYYP
ncbi:substrate-binding domain-containing protein, partial [Streptococcus suis]